MIDLPTLLSADELGVRLEIVGGLPLGEAHPVYPHQEAVDRIRASIEPARAAVAFTSPMCTSASPRDR